MRLHTIVGALVSTVLAHHAIHAQEYDISPLQPCNSPKAEYAPTYDVLAASIVFTSESRGRAALVRARLDESTGIEHVTGTYNDPRHQRGCVTLDTTGNGVGVVYLQHDAQAYASLTTVTQYNGAINLGSPIDAVNGPWYTSQPALSPDGERLVFVSTRDGGRGGMDLWISERRDDGAWSEPINLGRNLNSDADEVSPKFAAADTLIFASNGFGGKGGFDIMMSVLRDGIWNEPVPLDDLNSEYDDTDCALLPSGAFVFASNRPGGMGSYDLWIARRK